MTASNRQINTGFNTQKDQLIVLEATQPAKHEGKEVHAGETIRVSKSEAKRILAQAKGFFRIKMD